MENNANLHQKTEQAKPKAYSYLRFSTPEQSQGDSSRRQADLANRYAEKHGLELDETLKLQDRGVSAFRGRNAKVGALKAFLDAVDSGLVKPGSYLLVESLDRISRDAIVPAHRIFLEIIESGIVLVTLIDEKEFSMDGVNSNPTDLLVSILTLMRAHEESATKARRLKAAWENKRANIGNKPLTAKCPAWLTLDKENSRFIVDEEKADTVRRIFQMALDGVGQNSITETLNREGVPVFGKGRHWHRSYVIKILTNPAVKGTFVPHVMEVHNGKMKRVPTKPVENYYPAILEKDLFSRVQAMMMETSAPLRGRHAAGVLKNIFGGLAKCPLCGNTMTLVSKGKKGGKPYLVCSMARVGAPCQYKAVKYEVVEATFLGKLMKFIGEVPTGDGGGDLDERIEQTENNIEGTQAAIEKWLDEIQKGKGTTATYRRLRTLEESLDELKTQLNNLFKRRQALSSKLVDQKLKELRETASEEPLNRTKVNALLRQLLKGVVIDYEDGDLCFQWQHGGESDMVYAWPTRESTVVSNK